MMKIALFGTSADPPTSGHKIILSWLCERFDLVAVWAANNPFKTNQTSLEHRHKMLELLTTEINQNRPNIKVYPELSDQRTIITVETAQKMWKNAEFTLIIGSDIITPVSNNQGMPIMKWYRGEELLKQVKLIIIPRFGYNLSIDDLQQLEKIGAKYAIADLKVPGISSTKYREKMDKNILTSAVNDYIFQHRLYYVN